MQISSKIYLLTFAKHSIYMDKQDKIIKRTKPRRKYIEGDYLFYHFIKSYVVKKFTPKLNEREVDYLLREVNDWFPKISNYLAQVPEDCKHLERWFDYVETYATTPLQKGDIARLKEHFEQFKQRPTPQAEKTSYQIDWETLSTYFAKEFMGRNNKYNYFDECLRKDIPTIEQKNELAMVAVLIHRSEFFNKKRMRFAAWMRVFFKIIGVAPLVNTSQSRYEPNDRITRTFYYL